MIPWFRGRAAPGLILWRESARQARRPGMYALRFLLTLLGVTAVAIAIISGMTAGLDVASFSKVGRGAFIGMASCVQVVTALVVPLLVALGTVEEREEGTLDLVALTRLRPLQIVLGKATSRLALFGSLVLGLLPIVAMIVQYGGIGLSEIGLAATATAIIALQSAILAGFIALESRSVVLPWLAVTLWGLVFWVIAPALIGTSHLVNGVCPPFPADCGDFDKFASFSPLFAWNGGAGDLALSAALQVPLSAVLLGFSVPTFRASVANQERRGGDVWAIRLFRGLPVVILAVGGVWVSGMAWPWVLSATPPPNPPVDAIDAGTLVVGYAATLWMCRLLMGLGAAAGPWAFPLAGRRSRASRTRWTGPWRLPVVWRETFTRAYGAGAWVPWIGLLCVAGMFLLGAWLSPSWGNAAEGTLPVVVGLLHPFVLIIAWLVGTESGTQERPEILEPFITTTFGMRRLTIEKAVAATFRAGIPAAGIVFGSFAFIVAFGDLCAWVPIDLLTLVIRLAAGVFAAVAGGLLVGLVVRPVRLAWAISAACLVIPGLLFAAGISVIGLLGSLVYTFGINVPDEIAEALVLGLATLFVPATELGSCGTHPLVWLHPAWALVASLQAILSLAVAAVWMSRYGRTLGPGSAR